MVTARATASLNRAASLSGEVRARQLDVVQLMGEDTTGWESALWEIKTYPESFTPPEGWTLDARSGAYQSTEIRPREFMLPGSDFGKWDIDLTVNGTITDQTLRIELRSQSLGLEDIGATETTSRAGYRGQARGVGRNWRRIEDWASKLTAPGIVSTSAAGLASRITQVNSAFQADAQGNPFWGPLLAGTIRPQRLPNNYGALALWNFDGNLLDSSGNGRNLTVETGVQRYSQIWPGMRAIHLNGTTTLVYNVADPALRLTGDMSVTFILYLLTALYNTGPLFSHGVAGDGGVASNYLYDIEILNGPKVEWFQEYTGQADSFADFVDLPPVWPCVLTYVRSGGGTIITQYLNGQQWGTPSYNSGGALVAPTDGTSGRLRFGQSGLSPPACFLAGAKLDGRALSADEVKSDYNLSWGRAFGTI
ncbi:MAG TPA: hypothetical protein VG734_25860 [Lacunisphaera sp.]|nr:hypothetical protein [Lacunisphaera sp.]